MEAVAQINADWEMGRERIPLPSPKSVPICEISGKNSFLFFCILCGKIFFCYGFLVLDFGVDGFAASNFFVRECVFRSAFGIFVSWPQ